MQGSPHDGPRVVVMSVSFLAAVASRAAACNRAETCDLIVLTWNVLAQRWALQCFADGEYPLSTADDIAWTTRCPRIVAELEACGADVILLQEVDEDAFCQDFVPKLEAAGYRVISIEPVGFPPSHAGSQPVEAVFLHRTWTPWGFARSGRAASGKLAPPHSPYF